MDCTMNDPRSSAELSNEEAGMLCTGCFLGEEKCVIPVKSSRCIERINAKESHDDTRVPFSYMRFFLAFLLGSLMGYWWNFSC